MKLKSCILTLMLFCCVNNLSAHDPGSHWYIGYQTLQEWQDYDPAFYSLVDPARTDIWAVCARKFYFIGLALPDILDEGSQAGIAGVLGALYDMRDEIIQPAPGSAFDITDNTKNQVQTRITFLGEPPNSNFQKLKEMADWVRNPNNGVAVEDRGLVYGALMHVIHDLYAHMGLQPSRFGYGKVYHPSGLAPEDEPLFLAEQYYEILTPMYVPNWNFVKDDIFRSFYYDHVGGPRQLANPGIYCASFWRAYEAQLGTLVERFQELDFEPMQAFVDAAVATSYATSSLTQERLEAYIHGAGIVLFAMYGYESGGANLGGVFSHPEWTFPQAVDFVKNIGEAQWTIAGIIPLKGLVKAVHFETAVAFVFKLLKREGSFTFDGQRIFTGPWMDIALDVIGTNPWYTYFESPEGVDEI